MRAPVGRWVEPALRRLPPPARVILALVVAVLGGVLLLRPTTSLGVFALLIGVGLVLQGGLDLLVAARDPQGLRATAVAGALVGTVAGILVLLLPGLTVRLLAVVVGVSLAVDGALRLAGAVRRGTTADQRVAEVALGVATVIFGVLALTWPDVALIVVGVVFGARLVMAGTRALWVTVVGGRRAAPVPRRRWSRTLGAVLSLAVAGGAVLATSMLLGAAPVVEDFYVPPRSVPAEPGRLIRAEPFDRDVPDDARGWRILYTTTHGDGTAAVASGLVVVPAGPGPWPVVDWNHGTTGVAQHCAPSLATEPFASGALLVLPEIIAEGWALVATDYIGLGTAGPHGYLVGAESAHASLDAVRAAREVDEAVLGEQTVVWGHSQGGGAALWTGALAGEYAPDLRLDGVAALAPASDLLGLVEGLPQVTGGSVFASFVATAYAAQYDDVHLRDYIRPGARVTVGQLAERCLTPPGVLVSGLTALALTRDPDILATDPRSGPLGARLAQNEPPTTITAPLLLAQGGADTIISADVQSGYVDRLCAAQVGVDYRTFAREDHLSLVSADSPLIPELVEWTRDRFAGGPARSTCAAGAVALPAG